MLIITGLIGLVVTYKLSEYAHNKHYEQMRQVEGFFGYLGNQLLSIVIFAGVIGSIGAIIVGIIRIVSNL